MAFGMPRVVVWTGLQDATFVSPKRPEGCSFSWSRMAYGMLGLFVRNGLQDATLHAGACPFEEACLRSPTLCYWT